MHNCDLRTAKTTLNVRAEIRWSATELRHYRDRRRKMADYIRLQIN